MRGGYSFDAVAVGDEGVEDAVEVRPLDVDDDEEATFEAAWAFDMRSRMEWIDWTTLSWMTARHEAFSA